MRCCSMVLPIIAIVWRFTSVGGTSKVFRSASLCRRSSSAACRLLLSASATSRSRIFARSSSTPPSTPNCFANSSSRAGQPPLPDGGDLHIEGHGLPGVLRDRVKSPGRRPRRSASSPALDSQHLLLELLAVRDAVRRGRSTPSSFSSTVSPPDDRLEGELHQVAAPGAAPFLGLEPGVGASGAARSPPRRPRRSLSSSPGPRGSPCSPSLPPRGPPRRWRRT